MRTIRWRAAADCVVAIGKHTEACPNGLAPTSSTAVMMAVGDGNRDAGQPAPLIHAARLCSLSSRRCVGQKARQRRPDHAAVGSLPHCLQERDGARGDGDGVAIAPSNGRRDAGRRRRTSGGPVHRQRFGATLGDTRDDTALDQPIASRMTANPTTATQGSLLSEAMAVMSHRRISELPVIDEQHRPIGLLDITDLVSLSDSGDSRHGLADARS